MERINFSELLKTKETVVIPMKTSLSDINRINWGHAVSSGEKKIVLTEPKDKKGDPHV